MFLGAPRTQAAARGPRVRRVDARRRCSALAGGLRRDRPRAGRCSGPRCPARVGGLASRRGPSREAPAPLVDARRGARRPRWPSLAAAGARPVAAGRAPTACAARPTWDCGYAAPTARMQYTERLVRRPRRRLVRAGSCGPSAALRRPRGPFPARRDPPRAHPGDGARAAGRARRARALLRVSTAVRRLQHGRLQAYILYLVVGLAAARRARRCSGGASMIPVLDVVLRLAVLAAAGAAAARASSTG